MCWGNVSVFQYFRLDVYICTYELCWAKNKDILESSVSCRSYFCHTHLQKWIASQKFLTQAVVVGNMQVVPREWQELERLHTYISSWESISTPTLCAAVLQPRNSDNILPNPSKLKAQQMWLFMSGLGDECPTRDNSAGPVRNQSVKREDKK